MLLGVYLGGKVWCEVVTAVVLIDAGLVAVNNNFSREFSRKEMKMKSLASQSSLFSCE